MDDSGLSRLVSATIEGRGEGPETSAVLHLAYFSAEAQQQAIQPQRDSGGGSSGSAEPAIPPLQRLDVSLTRSQVDAITTKLQRVASQLSDTLRQPEESQ